MIEIETHRKKQELKEWPTISVIILQNKIALLITLILVLFAGFREIGFDRDSFNYAMAIQSIDFSGFSNLDFLGKEPSFYLIAYAAHWLFGDAVRGTFVIYALLGVTLKMAGIYRLSRIPLLSVIFYVSSYYLLHEMTQIRIGVASAIFLLAIPDIANKNFKAYITKAIFAILFHYSAIIMLLLYPILNTKMRNWFYYMLPILGLLFYFINRSVLEFVITNISILNFIPSFLSYKLILNLDLIQKGMYTEIRIFNLYYLSLMAIYYFCLVNMWRFKSDIDITLIKILGISLFTFFFLSFLPVFAFRISELLGIVIIILLASIVYIFKQKLLILLLVLIYSLTDLINFIFIQRIFKI